MNGLNKSQQQSEDCQWLATVAVFVSDCLTAESMLLYYEKVFRDVSGTVCLWCLIRYIINNLFKFIDSNYIPKQNLVKRVSDPKPNKSGTIKIAQYSSSITTSICYDLFSSRGVDAFTAPSPPLFRPQPDTYCFPLQPATTNV